MKIVIDGGHGDHDPGAVGPNGTQEKDVALRHALNLRDRLQNLGHEVRLTREDDSFLSLSARARIANEWGADLFLSIHCNAARRTSAKGFEAFTSPGITESDTVAEHLLLSYARANPDRPTRYDRSDGFVDKEASFTVLTKTSMAAVLFELGFISNPEEESWLTDDRATDRRCAALATGISNYHHGRPPGSFEVPKVIPEDRLEKSEELEKDFQTRCLEEVEKIRASAQALANLIKPTG